MLYFWKANGPRATKMIFWTVKYTNAQIQVHKYANTQIQHLRKGQKYYIYLYFWKANAPKTSKMIFWTVKYANTQIQHVRKCRKYPTYLYFWKANDTRTSKMIFWTVKYTNTQIQRHKCTNTLWRSAGNTQHVYIFKKPGIQGHQKWYSGLSKIQIHTRCDYYVSPNLKLWITDHWLTFALYHQVYYIWFLDLIIQINLIDQLGLWFRLAHHRTALRYFF